MIIMIIKVKKSSNKFCFVEATFHRFENSISISSAREICLTLLNPTFLSGRFSIQIYWQSHFFQVPAYRQR